MFPQAVKALLAVVMVTLPATVCTGQDWLTRYVPRQETTAEDSLAWKFFESPTRSLLHLNGVWRAREIQTGEVHDVKVPGTFQFPGQVEFTRTFKLDSTFAGKRLRLLAFGIRHRLRIFLNDDFVATRSGGELPFFVDLPQPRLRLGGRNKLRIVVDNQLGPRETLPLKHHPGLAADFGGIIRDIFILATPAISIEDVSVGQDLSDASGTARLTVAATVENRISRSVPPDGGHDFELRINIVNSAGRPLLKQSFLTRVTADGNRNEVKVEISAPHLQKWSPRTPSLYSLQLDLLKARRVVDRVVVPFGVRQLKMEKTGLVLNGEALRLKGVDYYEKIVTDNSGPSLADDIQTIKNLGANVVRVVGRPPSPYLLALCDRLGLLVFAELPLSFVPDVRFRDSDFVGLANNEMQDLLETAKRHPSLAAVGIGRDLEIGSPATRDFLTHLSELRAAPPFPLMYIISSKVQRHEPPESIDFVISRIFDAGGLLQRKKVATAFRIPLFYSLAIPLRQVTGDATNLGSPSEALLTGTDGERISITTQELQAHELWRVLSAWSPTGGLFISTLADWRESQPNLIFGWNHDSHWNRTGLLNLDGSKRLSYDIVAEYFSGKPGRRGASPKSSDSNPVVYPVVGISLILLFLFNFNRSKKLRGNLKRIFFYPHGFFSELRENRKVSYWHTFLLSLMTSVALGIITSSFAFYFRNSSVANDFMNLVLQSETTKLMLIRLCWQPLLSIPVFTCIWYSCFGCLILLLKLTSVVIGHYLSLSQLWILVFWSSANFLWLLPTIPIYYRLLEETHWFAVATLLVVVLLVWFCIRLLRGLKLVFHLSLFNAGVLTIILATLTVGVLAYHFQEETALFDYLPMYWRIFASGW